MILFIHAKYIYKYFSGLPPLSGMDQSSVDDGGVTSHQFSASRESLVSTEGSR